ncbi:hypothetical protein JCM16303_005014 [Sporobolomyces ruberrimus]
MVVLSRVVAPLVAAVVLASSSPIVSAAVLPNGGSSPSSVTTKQGSKSRPKGSKSSEEWCTPWFSGLVQTVKKTDHAEIVWKAVSSSDKGVMDGVKATNIGKSRTASMEPDLEWFVTPTSDGLFEITSGAGSSNCGSHMSGFDSLAQHALVPTPSTDCATPHVFSILCAACDRHDDSASGCLLHSRSRDKCVELTEEGKLKWGECADLLGRKRGWIGKEERDSRRMRQSWDITP